MERLGIALGSGLSPGEIVDSIKLAEELGYDSAWMVEGHGGEQFSILTACAVATSRIRLGTAISSVFVRSAPTIAMAAACLDNFSDGRFVLGLGSSHKVQVEAEHGIQYSKPVTRVRETVEVIRTLLRDGAVSFHGETISIEKFDLWFRPVRPSVPIYLSALFPQMLRLCGEIAEGLLLVFSTPESARRACNEVEAAAAHCGRHLDAIEIGSLVPVAIAPERKAAYDQMRSVLAFYLGFFPRYRRVAREAGFATTVAAVADAYERGGLEAARSRVSDEMIATLTAAGTDVEVRARLAEYRRAGIALPIIMPVAAPTDAAASVANVIRACVA
jgi:alkanesulfonate monooxygenase SsuD/methylene tetrahydromethanopterin reductase-like flavin-dependent oxidoreductase (luciferase family)